MVDGNESVYAPSYPPKSRAGSSSNYNPFSRQKKLDEVREPHQGLGVKGKGRGRLVAAANNSFSSMLKGTGRGMGLFAGLSSVGTSSSIGVSDDEN